MCKELKLRTTLAILLAVVGVVLVVIEAIAVLDPSGTQMANDGNPFDSVSPGWVHLLWVTVILGCFVTSCRLLRRSQ